MRYALTLALLVSLVACGKDSDDDDGNKKGKQGSGGDHRDGDAIPEAPVAGVIKGASWQLASAIVTREGSDGRLSLHLSDAPKAAPCDPFARFTAGERTILGSFEERIGEHHYGYSEGHMLTFSFDGDDGVPNNLFSDGILIIDALDAESMQARITIAFDDANQASGQFTARICPAGPYTPDQDFPAGDGSDPLLLGPWSAPQVIISTPTDWTWELDVTGPNTASTRLRTPSGDLIEDADEHWRIDSQATPGRLIREVTTSRVSVNGLKREGRKEYCIYEAAEASLEIQCGGYRFPQSFQPDAEVYKRR